MPILETGKKLFEKATGGARPGKGEVKALVAERKPLTSKFKDDGVIPNHPHWPLILYRGAVQLPSHLDPAAVFEDLFAMNKWGSSWRNGIYSFVHYHSQIHEVVGIAAGTSRFSLAAIAGNLLPLKRATSRFFPPAPDIGVSQQVKTSWLWEPTPFWTVLSLHKQRGPCAGSSDNRPNSKTPR